MQTATRVIALQGPPGPWTPTATSLYVATTGSDSHEGTSARPFATLSYALATRPRSDRTRIYIAPGSYSESFSGLIALADGSGPLSEPPAILGSYADAGLGTLTVSAVSVLANGGGVQITCTSGLVTDAWRDSFLRIATGAAASAVEWLIRTNDATSFTVLSPTMAGLAANDTIVIERPAAVITPTANFGIQGRLALYGVQLNSSAFVPVINPGAQVYMEGVRFGAGAALYLRGGRLRAAGLAADIATFGSPRMSIGTTSLFAGITFVSGSLNASLSSKALVSACGNASLISDFHTELSCLALDLIGTTTVSNDAQFAAGGTLKSRSGPIVASGRAHLGLANHDIPQARVTGALVTLRDKSFLRATGLTGQAAGSSVGVSMLLDSTGRFDSGCTFTGSTGTNDMQIGTLTKSQAELTSAGTIGDFATPNSSDGSVAQRS